MERQSSSCGHSPRMCNPTIKSQRYAMSATQHLRDVLCLSGPAIVFTPSSSQRASASQLRSLPPTRNCPRADCRRLQRAQRIFCAYTYHGNPIVCLLTVTQQVGVYFLQALNHFQRYAYVRQAHARETRIPKDSNQLLIPMPNFVSRTPSNRSESSLTGG